MSLWFNTGSNLIHFITDDKFIYGLLNEEPAEIY